MTVAALNAHLQEGATHSCHCWAVTRRDGVQFGFTDHDVALAFDGISFRPDSGLSAKALSSTTGLSVNNTEALGVLSAEAITDADIEAGRFDGAEVKIWLVQWDNVAAREVKFAGTIGEIIREAGTYRAELRGQTEMLNQPHGRAYLRSCSAVFGDKACKADRNDPAFLAEATIAQVDEAGQVFRFALAQPYTDRWFENGVLRIMSGAAIYLEAVIKSDDTIDGQRVITLWRPLPSPVALGDAVELVAGCDKRAETCRVKFDNLINFQGFPDIPGEDWLVSVPRSDGEADGGSRTR